MWVSTSIASLAIALPYFAISFFVARGLVASGQLRSNPLGLGTAMIFFSCGFGHLLHAEHMLFGGPEFRAAADLHMTLWDSSTAAIAIWYLSMRARYGQLLHPAMFEDKAKAEADAEARHLADHDHLTGLLNRQALLKVVGRALAPSDADEQRGLLFLDLDGFKDINDRLGHSAGDAVLTAVVARLRHALRPDDVLARLGGDEFVVLMHGAVTQDAAATVAERLSDALLAPILVPGDGSVLITTSIGIALTAPGELTASELLHEADLAMYHAKSQGPGEWSFGPSHPPAFA